MSFTSPQPPQPISLRRHMPSVARVAFQQCLPRGGLFMYDRESGAWERLYDPPEHHERVDRTIDALADVVARPGPLADLGCGAGVHALTRRARLQRRRHRRVPRHDHGCASPSKTCYGIEATFDTHDVSAGLPFVDTSLGGVLAFHAVQHLAHPGDLMAEVRAVFGREGICSSPLQHATEDHTPTRTSTGGSVQRSTGVCLASPGSTTWRHSVISSRAT